MENYKVKVGSKAESKEVQELFFAFGAKWRGSSSKTVLETTLDFPIVVCVEDGHLYLSTNIFEDKKELTIPQLRDMVVLKRNDVADATHTDQDNWKWFIGSDGIGYVWQCGNADNLKQWDELSLDMVDLKPITKEPVMKEYLNKLEDGTYKLVLLDSVADGVKGLIKVPDGADKAFQAFSNAPVVFKRSECGYSNAVIIWQRETLPEELPFIDDEPKYDPEDIGIAKGYDLDELAKEYKFRDRYDGEADEEYRYMLEHCISKESINDKVASAEVARQAGVFVGTPFSDLPESDFEAVDDVDAEFFPDNVNQPSHYCSHPSGIECIEITRHHDFAIGNAIKYLWRAGLKDSANEIQDLEKASWYIQDKINQLKKINDQKAK